MITNMASEVTEHFGFETFANGLVLYSAQQQLVVVSGHVFISIIIRYLSYNNSNNMNNNDIIIIIDIPAIIMSFRYIFVII